MFVACGSDKTKSLGGVYSVYDAGNLFFIFSLLSTGDSRTNKVVAMILVLNVFLVFLTEEKTFTLIQSFSVVTYFDLCN